MDSTTLNLLTRDGTVTVLIVPALENDHYTELHEAVCVAETAAELRETVKNSCDRWDRMVHFGQGILPRRPALAIERGG